MKKVLLTIFWIVCLNSAGSQPFISGKIHLTEEWEKTLYILRLDKIDLNYFELVDSIRLADDGSFYYTFKSDTATNLIYKVTLPPKGKNFRYSSWGENDNYFLISTEENDSLTLEADSDSLYYSIRISGGTINRSLLVYRDHGKIFFQISRAWQDAIRKYPLQEDSINRVMTQEWMEQIESYKQRVTQTLDTTKNFSMILAGLCYLNSAYLGILPSQVIKPYLRKVDHLNIPMVRSAIELAESVEANRRGLILPDIEVKDRHGDTHSLNSMSGKLTVIDFWASWCNPCRKANRDELPELYEAFRKGTDKQLISISIDKDHEKWKEALNDDKVTWPQYIDESRTFANLLSVHAVPLYLVLDEQKRIIFETISVYHLKQFLSNMDP